MSDTQEQFVSWHSEALRLRKKAESLRYQLNLVEQDLRNAERESSVRFRQLFNVDVDR